MATPRELAQSIMSAGCRIQNALDEGKMLTDSDVQELVKIERSVDEIADFLEEQ